MSGTHRVPRRRRLALRYRLSLAFTVLIGAACALLYFYVPARLHRQSVDALSDKARTIARITAYSAAPAVFFDDDDEIMQAFRATRDDIRGRVESMIAGLRMLAGSGVSGGHEQIISEDDSGGDQ